MLTQGMLSRSVGRVVGPRAEITVPSVTSVSPLPPVAPCHVNAGQYGGDTDEASGQNKSVIRIESRDRRVYTLA